MKQICEDWHFVFDSEHYLNPNRYYSYKNINIFILTGGRGIGKTTTFVGKACASAITDGDEFVYIRRYIAETKAQRNLLDIYLDNVKTKGLGNKGAYSYNWNGKTLGYCIPLSIQSTLKSVRFPKVKTIIFDEALLIRGGCLRYLDNECVQFFELISTIVRLRTDYRIFILSNNADVTSPYNQFFNIPRFEKSYIDTARGVYAENCPTKDAFIQLEQQTPLFKALQGTAYGDYHFNNKLLVKNPHTICAKPEDTKLWKRVGYNGYTIVLWYFQKDDGMYGLWAELKDGLIGENTPMYISNDQYNYGFIKAFRTSNEYRFIRDIYWRYDMSYADEPTACLVDEIMNDLK